MSPSPIHAIAKPTIALLATRAAIPALFRLMAIAGIHFGTAALYDGLRSIVAIVAVILYFVWFSRLYAWVRAARGGTQYTTGMAIGGWFIPFANLYIPYAALSDAWKRTTGQGNPLIAVFWISYILATVLTMFFSVWQTNPNILVIDRSTAWIVDLIGWSNTLSQIAAYGLWALIVKQLTDKVA